MRFLLAVDDSRPALLLSSAERTERSAKQLDLTPVLRPVPRPLRGDRPLVVGLGLAKQLADGG